MTGSTVWLRSDDDFGPTPNLLINISMLGCGIHGKMLMNVQISCPVLPEPDTLPL
jgi:hypothetical protein